MYLEKSRTIYECLNALALCILTTSSVEHMGWIIDEEKIEYISKDYCVLRNIIGSLSLNKCEEKWGKAQPQHPSVMLEHDACTFNAPNALQNRWHDTPGDFVSR